jgi:histidyl-tRNA synthetase
MKPDKELGLHFDLTVPFARYVVENRGRSWSFPLRRYQIQKSWRGERPALGRFREFLQADFDIISENELTVQSDFEIIDTAERNPTVAAHSKHPAGDQQPQAPARVITRDWGSKTRRRSCESLTSWTRLARKEYGSSWYKLPGSTPEQAERCLQLGQIKTNNPELH